MPGYANFDQIDRVDSVPAESLKTPIQPRPPQSSAHFWIVFTMLLVFAALLKLPTLSFPHKEPDEQIYLSLANNLITSGSYNLQGTEILNRLSPAIYDRPLFFHPPLFPLCLIPFVHWKIEQLAVIVSWLGHFLCILSVSLIARRILPLPKFDVMTAWLPGVGVTLDPLLNFVSRKLWIDSLLSGLCAISVAAFFCARSSSRRRTLLIVGGVFFGLAGLAKPTALILGPVILYLTLTPDKPSKSRLLDTCFSFLPAAVLLAPWYIVFYRTFGVSFPTWTKPDDWLIQSYPFVQATLNRTPWYYLVKIFLVAPISFIAFGGYILVRSHALRFALVPAMWFALWFATLSYLGLNGYGFQLRYIAPSIPAIYLMLLNPLALQQRNRDLTQIAALLLVLCGGMTAAIYLMSPQFDEIYSVFELMGWLRM